MRLVRPTKELEQAYSDYIGEWEASREKIVPLASERKGLPYDELLLKWERESKREFCKEGFVPSSLYFMIDDSGKIYGALHIRHELNEYLFNHGGHIGYGIRPSERRKGYAATMLGLALPYARELGIRNSLVTCDKNNPASARTIIRNGGILENEIPYEGGITQRYWISID